MSNQVALESLVGKHKLSGVDFGQQGEATTIVFILDGKTYMAVEDSDDGYRSSLGTFEVTDTVVKNTFEPQEVTCTYDGGSNDTLEIIDAITGKIVLRVGTDNSDDYYPSFVDEFSPQNMAINTKA